MRSVRYTLPLLVALLMACGGQSRPAGSAPEDWADAAPDASPGPIEDANCVDDCGNDGGPAPCVVDIQGPDAVPAAPALVRSEGQRIYVLSANGVLSVVDASSPGTFGVLRSHHTSLRPTEMLVRDEVVFALSRDDGAWELDAQCGEPRRGTASHLVTLDTRVSAAEVKEAEDFELPGWPVGFVILGDVLYAVTYENPRCWSCSDAPRTHVMSYLLGDRGAMQLVDRLTIDEAPNLLDARRALDTGQGRLYLAGPDHHGFPNNESHSTLDVVDVSDPGGMLALSARVPLHGQVRSAAQMSELDGVLRVASQAGSDARSGVPTLQTFTITKESKLQPLGQVALTGDEGQTLDTVLFQGETAYVALRGTTSHLVAVDLRNASMPIRSGTADFHGAAWALRVHGNSLVGVGGSASSNGSPPFAVWLFRVDAPLDPQFVQGLGFGPYMALGNAGSFFPSVAGSPDDTSLISFPFSSQTSYPREDGVQLVQVNPDGLVMRGIAPQWGPSPAPLLLNEQLVTASDGRLVAHDLSNLDSPQLAARVSLTAPTHKAVAHGDYVYILSHDKWTGELRLLVQRPGDPALIGELALGALNPPSAECDAGAPWTYGWYHASLFANANLLYLVTPPLEKPEGVTACCLHYPLEQKSVLAAVDLSDPAHPTLLGTGVADLTSYGGFTLPRGYFGFHYKEPAPQLLRVGTTIVGLASRSAPTLLGFDFSDPVHPTLAGAFPLSTTGSAAGLAADGRTILTTTLDRSSAGGPSHTLHRVSFDDPGSPHLVDQADVRGMLLSFDPASARMIGLDEQSRKIPASNATECGQADFAAQWNPLFGCTAKVVTLHMLDLAPGHAELRQSLDVRPQEYFRIAVGGDRVYVVHSASTFFDGSAGQVDARVFAVLDTYTGTGTGAFTLQSSTRTGVTSFGRLYAQGSHVGILGFPRGELYDATDPTNPKVVARLGAGAGADTPHCGWTDHAFLCGDRDDGVTSYPLGVAFP